MYIQIWTPSIQHLMKTIRSLKKASHFWTLNDLTLDSGSGGSIWWSLITRACRYYAISLTRTSPPTEFSDVNWRQICIHGLDFVSRIFHLGQRAPSHHGPAADGASQGQALGVKNKPRAVFQRSGATTTREQWSCLCFLTDRPLISSNVLGKKKKSLSEEAWFLFFVYQWWQKKAIWWVGGFITRNYTEKKKTVVAISINAANWRR